MQEISFTYQKTRTPKKFLEIFLSTCSSTSIKYISSSCYLMATHKQNMMMINALLCFFFVLFHVPYFFIEKNVSQLCFPTGLSPFLSLLFWKYKRFYKKKMGLFYISIDIYFFSISGWVSQVNILWILCSILYIFIHFLEQFAFFLI